MDDGKTCYTIKETEKILGVGDKAVRHLIRKGYFKTLLLGNKYYILKKSLEEWLDGPGVEELKKYKYVSRSGGESMEEKRCYTVKELQDMLGISRQSVYALIKRNEFNTVTIAGKHCVSKRSFDAWLDGLEEEKREPELTR